MSNNIQTPALLPREDESLTMRFTVRLPEDLRGWVRQQGGSSYVRDLLTQQRAAGIEATGTADRSLRSKSSLRDQWEQLTYERGSLEDERALLRDEERLLDRKGNQLDREWRLLDERRDQLEDEWYELEQARMELESREQLLAGLFRPALVPLDLIDLPGGRRV